MITARHLAGTVAVFGVALALVGIILKATFNGKIYGFWELVQGGAPFGPFVNKNHFAGWMLMGLPVALGYFLARRWVTSTGAADGWATCPLTELGVIRVCAQLPLGSRPPRATVDAPLQLRVSSEACRRR